MDESTLSKVQQALDEQRLRYQELMEFAPDAYLVTDREGKILEANQAAGYLLDERPEALVGQSLVTFIANRKRPSFHTWLRRIDAGQPIRGWETAMRTSSGEVIPVALIVSPINHSAQQDGHAVAPGRTTRLRWMLHNLTSRRRTEAQFAYQAYLLEHVSDAVIATDENFILTSWNSGAEAMYGWKAEEAIGRRGEEVIHTELSGTERWQALRMLRETGQVQGEFVQYGKDGSRVVVDARLRALYDEQGRVTGYVSVNRDITVQKEMEVELAEVHRRLMDRVESERLSLAQELHDGPVQELYGLSFKLQTIRNSLSDEQIVQDLEEAQELLRRVVQELRGTTGELRPPVLAPFGLEKAIRSHADGFQREHPELLVRLDLDADAQMLPERTRFTLFRIYRHSLANVVRHAQASQVAVRFQVQPERVVLEVEDDGHGFAVPERWINLVRAGHFGLAGSAERAESLGGELQVKSHPGEGTLIRAIVPKPRQT